MKALIMNCSPVRAGATAEIVKLVSEQLSAKYSVRCICIMKIIRLCIQCIIILSMMEKLL